MAKSFKDSKNIEIIVKGFANFRRVQILDLLQGNKSLSLNDIAYKLKIGFRAASQHLDKMLRAGLIVKSRSGASVLHNLTPRGAEILKFIQKIER